MANAMMAGLPPTHPGEVLRDIVLPSVGTKKADVARLLGISRQHLYDILNGKKPVTIRTALRLSRMFGGTSEMWLRMQEAYDLRTIEPLMAEELAAIPLLMAA